MLLLSEEFLVTIAIQAKENWLNGDSMQLDAWLEDNNCLTSKFLHRIIQNEHPFLCVT